jgi:hypothetical protein
VASDEIPASRAVQRANVMEAVLADIHFPFYPRRTSAPLD